MPVFKIHHVHEVDPAIECLLHRAVTALENIKLNQENLMGKFSEYAVEQKAFNQDIKAGLDGIATDIDNLNAKIDKLQNSQGEVSEEDQVLINELQADGAALRDRVKVIDEKTPPEVPPAP